MTTEVGIPGKGKAQVGLLPWACHNLWLIYRHKMDDDILRNKLFPLLKESINYYLHFLKEGDDGKLHLPATYSPNMTPWKIAISTSLCYVGDAKHY